MKRGIVGQGKRATPTREGEGRGERDGCVGEGEDVMYGEARTYGGRALPSSRRRGCCPIKKMSRSLQSGADGVVGYAAKLGRSEPSGADGEPVNECGIQRFYEPRRHKGHRGRP